MSTEVYFKPTFIRKPSCFFYEYYCGYTNVFVLLKPVRVVAIQIQIDIIN